MAHGVITLGEVAACTKIIEVLCGRCARRGRLFVARLLTEHGPGASMRDVMHAQIGDCPHRDDALLRDRRAPYCPDLPRLF